MQIDLSYSDKNPHATSWNPKRKTVKHNDGPAVVQTGPAPVQTGPAPVQTGPAPVQTGPAPVQTGHGTISKLPLYKGDDPGDMMGLSRDPYSGMPIIKETRYPRTLQSTNTHTKQSFASTTSQPLHGRTGVQVDIHINIHNSPYGMCYSSIYIMLTHQYT